jgi:cardiolipin synthase
MNRFIAGNRIALLRSGGEFFPALVGAIDRAEREVWLETYIFADDDAGRIVSAALCRAAQRGVKVRVLVDGWGARHTSHAGWKHRSSQQAWRCPARPEVAPCSSARTSAASASQALRGRRSYRFRRRHQRDRRREHADTGPAR